MKQDMLNRQAKHQGGASPQSKCPCLRYVYSNVVATALLPKTDE